MSRETNGVSNVAMRRAVTLVEVLVALTVLALAGAALASVQLGALRSGRTAQVRQVAAEALAQELLYQRLGPAATAGDCSAVALEHGWTCEVSTSCPVLEFGCGVQLVEVVVTPPDEAPLSGVSVRFEALLGQP